MNLNIKKLTPEERYNLIGKLIEEIKLRKYSYQTGKACGINLKLENSWEDLIRKTTYHQTK